MGTKGLTPEKIRAALALSDYSVTAAARLLGVSRQAVHAGMRRHGIVVEKSLPATGDKNAA
jgi:transcriptional regulator with GAF, ATPase, and Fis domain